MSLFKKLFRKIKEQESPKEERSKYLPEVPLPTDEKFTYYFRKNGGKFLYCENIDELDEAFDNILLENDWYEKEVFCTDKTLTSKFNNSNLKYGTNTSAAFFFSRCESLVADAGAILISSNQIKEKKLKDLPDNFIIFATTSQLVDTIGEGLRIIKSANKNNIPSNITTIKNFESKKENDFMTYGSSSKNLYLLLLEDL
jgi:hypothetical protein